MFWDLQNIWVCFPEKLTSADNIQRHPLWLTIPHEILFIGICQHLAHSLLSWFCSNTFLVVPWALSVQHLPIFWHRCSNHQAMLYRWPRNGCSHVNLFLVTQCRYCADEDSSSSFWKGFHVVLQQTFLPATIKMYSGAGLFKQHYLWSCSLK